jgi:hypothetical protein
MKDKIIGVEMIAGKFKKITGWLLPAVIILFQGL